jgi:hypothetical protein
VAARLRRPGGGQRLPAAGVAGGMCSCSSPPRSGAALSRRRRWQRSIAPAPPLLGSPSWRPASWWFATTRRRPMPSWPTSPPPRSPWSAGPGGTGCGAAERPAAADGSSRPGRGSGGAHLPAATEPESPGSRNVAGPNRPDRSSSSLELGTSAADPGGQVGAELDGHDPAAPLGQRQRRLAGSRADLQDARTGSDPREVGQVVEQRRRVPRGRARPYSPAAWSNVARSRSGARASLAPPGS